MKLDTFVLFSRGGCLIIVGFGTALVSGLAQWATSGDWPPKVNWVIIIGASFVSAATQLLGFLSTSFADYKRDRNPNAQPDSQPQPPAKP